MVSRNRNGNKLRRRTLWSGETSENGSMTNPISLLLNGEPRHLDSGTSISSLLESEGLAQRRVAVEVNGEIVPRGRHATHVLQAGDTVEIVHALGGG